MKNDFSCHVAVLGGGVDRKGFGSWKGDGVGAFFFADCGTPAAVLDAPNGDDIPYSCCSRWFPRCLSFLIGDPKKGELEGCSFEENGDRSWKRGDPSGDECERSTSSSVGPNDFGESCEGSTSSPVGPPDNFGLPVSAAAPGGPDPAARNWVQDCRA